MGISESHLKRVVILIMTSPSHSDVFTELGFQVPEEKALQHLTKDGCSVESLREVLKLYKAFNLKPPCLDADYDYQEFLHPASFDQHVMFLWANKVMTPYFDFDPVLVNEFIFEWAQFDIESDDPTLERPCQYREMEPARPLAYTKETFLDYFKTVNLQDYFKHSVGKPKQLPPGASAKAKSRVAKNLRSLQKEYDEDNRVNNFYLQKYFKTRYESKEQFLTVLAQWSIFKLYSFLVFLETTAHGEANCLPGLWKFINGKEEEDDGDFDESDSECDSHSSSEEEDVKESKQPTSKFDKRTHKRRN